MKTASVIKSIVIIILLSFSCAEEEALDVDSSCNGCSKDAPWSTPGSTTCYADINDCRNTEGRNCTYCNP